jgi:hypothetical protein
MNRFLLIAFAAALAAPAAGAQPTPPATFSLAFVDDLFDGEPVTEVNLAGPMLGAVADASRGDDPAFAETLEDMSGVFVREYSLSQARAGALDRIRGLGRTLQRDGWQTMVRSRDEDGETYIFSHERRGMVVVTLDTEEDEATFVEIRGHGTAQQFGRLGGRFMRNHSGGN